MYNKYKLLIVIGLIILLLDQWTKYYIDTSMQLYQSIEVIENFFNITYVRNPGAAFGILNTSKGLPVTVFFISISTVACFVILYLYRQSGKTELNMHIALSLVLGGAIGNLIDRITRKEVIDFFDVHWYQHHWPVFNIADSAITVGMILLSFSIFFLQKENKEPT